MLRFLFFVGDYSEFAIRSILSMFGILFRVNAWIPQLYNVFIGALPLGVVGGFALGAVVWMHLHTTLSRTGTSEALPTFLAAAIFMELAPIGAGLIMAGRTGASFGAELGALKLTEQIDAISMLGLSPIRQLVAPRVLACMLALPLFHFFISTLALLSSYGIEAIVAHTSWAKYETTSLRELYLIDVLPAALKTIVFGFLIGTISCFAGFRATGGTEGVGKAATEGVVGASLMVLAADVFLVALIHAVLD